MKTLEGLTNAVVPTASAEGVPMAGAQDPWSSFKPYQEAPTAQPQQPTQDPWSSFKPYQEGGVAPQAPTQDTQATPQATAPRTITDKGFNADPTWISNAKKIYQDVEGKSFSGKDADAADWLKNYVAQTNWNLGGAATTIMDASNKLSPDSKKALLQSIQEYSSAPTSLESVGRAFKGIATDPTTYAGLGVGSLATKTIGKTAANAAVKRALKEGLARGVGQRTAANLTGQTAQLAATGAGYGAAENTLQQGVQVAADGQEGVDLGQVATSGALAGAGGVGVSKLVNRLTGRNEITKLAKRAGSENQARLDAEIATDLQDIAKNPTYQLQEDGTRIVSAQPRNTLAAKYVSDVENAIRVVDPELLKGIDFTNLKGKEKIATPEQLALIRQSPNGNLLADSVEKLQRTQALTQQTPASGSMLAKLTRLGLEQGPRVAGAAIGGSLGGPLGAAVGALTRGVTPGTAQRLTGKLSVQETIEKLATGKGLKAAKQVQEALGASDIAKGTDDIIELARQKQTAQKAAQEVKQKTIDSYKQASKEASNVSKEVLAENWTKGNTASGGVQGTMTGYTGLKDKDLITTLEALAVDKPALAPYIERIKSNSSVPNVQLLGVIQDEAVRKAQELGIKIKPELLKNQAIEVVGVVSAKEIPNSYYTKASNIVSSLGDDNLTSLVNRTTSSSGAEIKDMRKYGTSMIAKILYDKAENRVLSEEALSILKQLGQ
jgi:hypothetical protein